MKIKKSNTSESTVERRFKRRQYKRKVSLREYSRATDHFDYVLESQFRRKQVKLGFTRACRSIDELGKKWLKTWQN